MSTNNHKVIYNDIVIDDIKTYEGSGTIILLASMPIEVPQLKVKTNIRGRYQTRRPRNTKQADSYIVGNLQIGDTILTAHNIPIFQRKNNNIDRVNPPQIVNGEYGVSVTIDNEQFIKQLIKNVNNKSMKNIHNNTYATFISPSTFGALTKLVILQEVHPNIYITSIFNQVPIIKDEETGERFPSIEEAVDLVDGITADALVQIIETDDSTTIYTPAGFGAELLGDTLQVIVTPDANKLASWFVRSLYDNTPEIQLDALFKHYNLNQQPKVETEVEEEEDDDTELVSKTHMFNG